MKLMMAALLGSVALSACADDGSGMLGDDGFVSQYKYVGYWEIDLHCGAETLPFTVTISSVRVDTAEDGEVLQWEQDLSALGVEVDGCGFGGSGSTTETIFQCHASRGDGETDYLGVYLRDDGETASVEFSTASLVPACAFDDQPRVTLRDRVR